MVFARGSLTGYLIPEIFVLDDNHDLLARMDTFDFDLNWQKWVDRLTPAQFLYRTHFSKETLIQYEPWQAPAQLPNRNPFDDSETDMDADADGENGEDEEQGEDEEEHETGPYESEAETDEVTPRVQATYDDDSASENHGYRRASPPRYGRRPLDSDSTSSDDASHLPPRRRILLDPSRPASPASSTPRYNPYLRFRRDTASSPTVASTPPKRDTVLPEDGMARVAALEVIAKEKQHQERERHIKDTLKTEGYGTASNGYRKSVTIRKRFEGDSLWEQTTTIVDKRYARPVDTYSYRRPCGLPNEHETEHTIYVEDEIEPIEVD